MYITSGDCSKSIDNNLHQFVPNLSDLQLYVHGIGMYNLLLFSKSL